MEGQTDRQRGAVDASWKVQLIVSTIYPNLSVYSIYQRSYSAEVILRLRGRRTVSQSFSCHRGLWFWTNNAPNWTRLDRQSSPALTDGLAGLRRRSPRKAHRRTDRPTDGGLGGGGRLVGLSVDRYAALVWRSDLGWQCLLLRLCAVRSSRQQTTSHVKQSPIQTTRWSHT